MDNETKICSKCGIEKLKTEFHKRNDKPCGVQPQCKQCKKKYAQSKEGHAVADDKEIYNSLDAEGQGKIDKLATALMFNLQKKITADPLNSIGLPKTLNMGTDSARHIILRLIRFMSIQEP